MDINVSVFVFVDFDGWYGVDCFGYIDRCFVFGWFVWNGCDDKFIRWFGYVMEVSCGWFGFVFDVVKGILDVEWWVVW